jgi:hypothetical protein
MARRSEQVGVCTLRVWRYGPGTMVRLQMRVDVEEPATERVTLAQDVETALAEVRLFLEAFSRVAGQEDPPGDG